MFLVKFEASVYVMVRHIYFCLASLLYAHRPWHGMLMLAWHVRDMRIGGGVVCLCQLGGVLACVCMMASHAYVSLENQWLGEFMACAFVKVSPN